jgi:hypothetical protein
LSLDPDPALVVDDFFVEPVSGRVQREGSTRVPLVTLAAAAEGLTIYAFRDHHQMHLVLAAARASMIGPAGEIGGIACGMARLSLETSGKSVALSLALGLPGLLQPERVERFRAYGPIPMQRAVRVSASVSRIGRDPAPILSLVLTDPSRPIQNALNDRMPSWDEVLGTERAQALEQQFAKREGRPSDRLDAEEVSAGVP